MGIWKKLNAWFDRQNFVLQSIILLSFVFVVRTWIFGLYQVPTGSMETTMLAGEKFLGDKMSYWFRAPRRGEIIVTLQPELRHNSPSPSFHYAYADNALKNIWQRYVWGPQCWTKRVIGLPGEHIMGKIENGHPVVYVNDKKLDEPYINTYPLVQVWNCSSEGHVRIEDIMKNPAILNGKISPRSYDPQKSYAEQPFYRMTEHAPVDLPGLRVRLEPGTPLEDGRDVFDVQLGKDEYWLMGDNRLGSYDSRYFGMVKEKLIIGRVLYCLTSLDSHESWHILDFIKHPLDVWTRVRWGRFFKRLH